MEDVELIIKIPENLYKHIMSMQFFIPGRSRGKTTLAEILAAIRRGTPLLKGHWREVDTNMYACSKCSHVLTIDPLDNSILEMNTCPFCSAKMEGVVDDKGRNQRFL